MILSTERYYYENPYCFELQAAILEVGRDEKGAYVIFDKTIFHPQGGGQPDDRGEFVVGGNHFRVTGLAVSDEELVKHYFEELGLPKKGDVALQRIDGELRKMHARWHSAGHLISNALHSLYPQLEGCSGNHFPGQAFVNFRGAPLPEDLAEVQKNVEGLVNRYIQQNFEGKSWRDGDRRMIQFGEFPAYPCGGTHVQRSGEIGSIKIRSVKREKMRLKSSEEKETILKVKYEIK